MLRIISRKEMTEEEKPPVFSIQVTITVTKSSNAINIDWGRIKMRINGIELVQIKHKCDESVLFANGTVRFLDKLLMQC